MDVIKSILERRSIRVYKEKLVDDSLIKDILEKSIWAPSACNRQAWKFIIIKSSKIKQRLVSEGTAYFVKKSPALILVLYDNRTDNEEYKDYIQSASALIQNIHLIAYSKGLGSCWINNLPLKKDMRKIFKIPNFYEPIALITLGYPKHIPKPPKRIQTIDQLVSLDRFNFNEKSIKNKSKLKTRILFRKIYFNSPTIIKRLIEPITRRFERRFDK